MFQRAANGDHRKLPVIADNRDCVNTRRTGAVRVGARSTCPGLSRAQIESWGPERVIPLAAFQNEEAFVMGHQLRMTPQEVDELRRRFEELPEAEPEKLSKRQIVERLLPTIEVMKSKGYGLMAIARKFTENGVPLSVSGLKNILGHPSSAGAEPKSRRRRKGKPPAQRQPVAETTALEPTADNTAQDVSISTSTTGVPPEPSKRSKAVSSP